MPSNSMWEAAESSEDQAFQTSLITTGVNVAFTLGAIALVDIIDRVGRVGRKPLLLVGSISMATMLAFNTYVAFFAATWGPVVWVLLGEMFVWRHIKETKGIELEKINALSTT